MLLFSHREGGAGGGGGGREGVCWGGFLSLSPVRETFWAERLGREEGTGGTGGGGKGGGGGACVRVCVCVCVCGGV